VRRTLGQIRAYFTDAAPVAELNRRARAGIFVGRLGLRILAQWARDRCPQQASALAYQTTLSMVPILAIAFALLRSMGTGESEDRLLDYMATYVLPNLRELIPYLKAFSAKISIGAAGGVGLIITLVTCYSLYASVEQMFNDIWRVPNRRGVVGKFLTFYALVTLLPVLGAASIYWSGRLVGESGVLQVLGPLAIQFAALLLTNKLLPNLTVKWRAALMGAMASGIAIEALKWGFLKFAKAMLLEGYVGVYGPLALVPMVLLWIYLSWLLILLGAEIAHAFQNLSLLEAEERRQHGKEPLNALVATQLLAAVAAHHERGGPGLAREQLSKDFALSADVVGRIVERLKENGLVAEVRGDKVGLIPARASNAIRLDDILEAFRATDLQIARGALSPNLAQLLHDLDETRQRQIAGVTLADLLPADPATPRPVPTVPRVPPIPPAVAKG
jgi:membrane protein